MSHAASAASLIWFMKHGDLFASTAGELHTEVVEQWPNVHCSKRGIPDFNEGQDKTRRVAEIVTDVLVSIQRKGLQTVRCSVSLLTAEVPRIILFSGSSVAS